MIYRLILLDLDGTVLHTDKTVSEYTLSVLRQCQAHGVQLGIITARGESNILRFIRLIRPDLVISSSGALVKWKGSEIYRCAFDAPQARSIIDAGLRLTGGQCEITVDTPEAHYWNYKEDPHIKFPDWGQVTYTDYSDFHQPSLKICLELPDEGTAIAIAQNAGCDYARFSGGNWYQFSRKGATKAAALQKAQEKLNIAKEQIIAFGDDYVDIEMLQYCGLGVAMGNAIEAVREIADDIALTNDEDGVARYLENLYGFTRPSVSCT